MNTNLLLHCGANVVDRNEVYQTLTPHHTLTHYPMSHAHVIEEVESRLWNQGFQIKSRTHALSHENARYFGIVEVTKPETEHEDYSWIIGIRNSHDKSMSAGVVAGSRVFVCDNLAFSGMIKIQRKHTRFVQRDFRELTTGAVIQLDNHLQGLDKRIQRYKEIEVTDIQAHDLIIKAVDNGAITNSQIPDVVEQWRTPDHECFEARSAWSLSNAYTDVLKRVNPHTQVTRGERLQELFDKAFPLALAS